MMKGFIALLVISLIFITACGKDEAPAPTTTTAVKPQCFKDTDCPPGGTCETASCLGGKCSLKMKDNCCGNLKCEANSSETKCSCAADCKTGCEGDVSFITNDGRTMKSKYFSYGCSGTSCNIKYDPGRIDPRQAYHDVFKDYIYIGLVLNYIEPFEVNQGEMTIELKLKDVKTDLIKYPININEIRVMEDSLLLGRIASPKSKFTQVGDSINLEIPVSYSMQLPEELKWVTVQIDMSYIELKKFPQVGEDGKPVKDSYGDLVYVYKELGTKTTQISQRLSKQVYFIDPDYNQQKVDFSQ